MDNRQQLAADVRVQLQRRFQYYLDKTVIYPLYRWIGLAALMVVYGLRAFNLGGFYIVSYGLGIYLLNLFIGFLSPQQDPETEGPVLPTKNSEEYRPFTRKVPEFTAWFNAVKAVCIAFVMTFISIFDVPVFWPILVIYFLALFGLTMRKQIAHMMKYKYVPINWGKKKYAGDGKDKKKGSGSAPSAAGLMQQSSGAAEPMFKGSSSGMMMR